MAIKILFINHLILLLIAQQNHNFVHYLFFVDQIIIIHLHFDINHNILNILKKENNINHKNIIILIAVTLNNTFSVSIPVIIIVPQNNIAKSNDVKTNTISLTAIFNKSFFLIYHYVISLM